MPERATIFPVDEILPALTEALKKSRIVILSAPPGAGKTTRVPPALLASGMVGKGNMLMLEPRRLAARRASEFMAMQLGERVGGTVGYRIRGETRVGSSTRIEVLTEGILTHLLQEHPDVPDVGLIIFDEFHERSIHADLGLAFALDVQTHLRPDLKILVMSATLNGLQLSALLGNAPIIESRGRIFPIETQFATFVIDKPIEVRVADTIVRAVSKTDGDVLVFLPGWREIQRVERLLFERRLPEEIIVHTLHGEASSASQNAALAPAPLGRRKVILSTNVAETSLTIEGVCVVVDSGFVRVSRFDPRRGMSGLVTVPISRASAEQRRGRAGRLAPGVCYRLWTEAEHTTLQEFSQPEIKSADLAPLALELIRWGSPNGENLFFLDPPPEAHLKQAQNLLRQLEAIDEDGKLTSLGRMMSKLPTHPRLAHMIVRGKERSIGRMACRLAALLEERDLFGGSRDADVDLASRWHELHVGRGAAIERITAQARRLVEIAEVSDKKDDETKLGLLLAFAYPDRIAKRKEKAGSAYVLSSGSTATLPAGSLMAREEFIVVADTDTVGSSTRIVLAAPIARDFLLEYFHYVITEEEDVRWNSSDQAVVARRIRALGAVVISEQPIDKFDERIATAMMDGIRELGLQALPWTKESQSLCERVNWLRKNRLGNQDWPDFSEDGLLQSLERWLLPFLSGIRQRSQLASLDLQSILRSHLTHEQLRQLDRLAPSHLNAPSGSRIAIDYGGETPVMAVRLQELFGQVETPRVGGGTLPVVVHLLSPAKRPLAVTQDLASFWKNVYPEIRTQMRARYPKHVWPDDPLTAKPTNKTKRRTRKP